MLYSGHITGPADQQIPMMQQLQQRLQVLVDRWDADGLSREIISSGSTPSALFSHHLPLLTEIRPGTYVYNDMNIVRGGYDTVEHCAARVHTTVVSANVENQVVIDAGSKTLTSDLCGPAPDSGHGLIVEYPKAKVFRLTEEHGQVDVSNCDQRPSLGERLTLIPNHICVCVNMQNSVWWQEPDVEAECRRVDGRGLLV
jgi:D-serine deaminase-like pyridoxal phosphate-dependent protein